MINMYRNIVRHKMAGTLITVACALPLIAMPSAEAHVGTGIGITLPVGGSSGSGQSNIARSYAAFGFDKVFEELTVEDRHGRLKLELKVTNNGDSDYTVPHRTGQVYDMAILDKNSKVLWRWSDSMAFTQALTSSSVPAHQNVVYTAELSSRDYRKLKDDAVLISAWLQDTPYVIMTRLPTRVASSTPVVLQGGIIIGSGHGPWYDD